MQTLDELRTHQRISCVYLGDDIGWRFDVDGLQGTVDDEGAFQTNDAGHVQDAIFARGKPPQPCVERPNSRASSVSFNGEVQSHAGRPLRRSAEVRFSTSSGPSSAALRMSGRGQEFASTLFGFAPISLKNPR
ncbi:hypothetical protein, partial [Methylorubrum thiocyanatum]|uniref:hypothetical protein n=2 Tax=Methylorubrum thiocyanatum TaxID=47958 RepID=UPI001EFAB08D